MHLRPLVHTARLVVKPRPVNLSESFAILRHLKRWGEVTKFAKHTIHSPPTGPPPQQSRTVFFQDATSVVYAVDFASIPQPFVESSPRREQDKHSLRFKIDANAFQPDPQDLDPYNVRGLLTRKPNPAPRRFSCKLTLLDEKQCLDTPTKNDDRTATASVAEDELEINNPYSGPFSVDRKSVFTEILQQTGAPSDLIPGLLPKVEENQEPEEAASDGTWSEQYARKHGRPPSKSATRKWLYAKKKRLRVQPRVVKGEHFSLTDLYNKAMARPREE